ncbi:MAG TPA: crosslink repair DNA glycosylase YcaQ family protein [Thermoplasmata archaeon]|nr:crosslink repair DNA glycosylase YcaQ family protein [Thermoplasmata archaeon]
MTATKLSPAEARRIAIRAQALDGSVRDVLDVVRRLGLLQLDPTNRVAPSHLLVLWSRLGPFDRTRLDRLLWRDRSLFEWRAYVLPSEDYPLVKPEMLRFPGDKGAWQRRVGDWLRDNESFRRYVLHEIRRRGPLLSRDLKDRATRPWPSGGWTAGRNVTQMLHFLSTRGEVMVSRREGGQRVWDLPERVLPVSVLNAAPASEDTVARRRLRALGLVRPSSMYRDVGERVRVLGVDGEWIADKGSLDRVGEPLPSRMTLLSPFDRLIYDRERTEDLFRFRYRIEIYVPKAKRAYGFYALPILAGERIVGRVDSALDRGNRILRVHAVHSEPGARFSRSALRETLLSLAEFLGATRIQGL